MAGLSIKRVGVIALGLCLVGSLCGASVPVWQHKALPWRALLTPATSVRGSMAIEVSQDVAEGPLDYAVCDAEGTALSARLLRTNGPRASFLVSLPSQMVPPVQLYIGPAKRGGTQGSTNLVERRPLGVEYRRRRGAAAPNTWDRMRYMFSRSPEGYARSVNTFGDTPTTVTTSRSRRSHRRGGGRWLLRFHAWVLCPETGAYRFGLRAPGGGYMTVDGELMAGHAPGGEDDGILSGQPMFLEAGLHWVEIYADRPQGVALQPRWALPSVVEGAHDQPPSLTAIPLSAFASRGRAESVQVEHRDQPLHAGFKADPKSPYTFRHSQDEFYPVTFENLSRHTQGRDFVCRWDFGDGGRSRQRSPGHTFRTPGPHTVVLHVEDDEGAVSEWTETVDLRFRIPAQMTLEARILNLPPACFGTDAMNAVLWVSGETPSHLPLHIEADVVDIDGKTTEVRQRVAIDRGAVFIPLSTARAEHLDRIDWSLRHRGTVLQSGKVDFIRAPYDRLPVRASGDRLLDADGHQLVLLSERSRRDHSRDRAVTPSLEQVYGHLLCVDDSLAGPGIEPASDVVSTYAEVGRLLDGPDRPRVTVESLTPDPHHGAAPVADRLVHIATHASGTGDVVVLSLGLDDMLQHRSPDQFERHVAALTDMVTLTIGKPVVWVTPPPFPPNPDESRPYAAAIRRVADARGLPVADLYTAFRGVRETTPSLFSWQSQALSDRGRRVAARIIARALLAGH